ncbi:MAG: ATP-binding cassette domain-containing protein [Beijerinckiaceae bacterium]|nr:ATP-binding cassette domain-containing protein [Beijerinckiaceae bacterium]
MLPSLLRLFRDVYRVTGRRLPLLVILTFLNALLDGAAVAALLPLLKAVGGTPGAGDDRVTQSINTALTWFGFPVTASAIAAFAIGLMAFGVIVFLAQAYLGAKLQTEYVAAWQRRLFAGYFGSEFGFFRERRAGDLISAGITEPVRLGGAFYQANLILSSVLFIGVQIAVALVIAPVVVAMLFGAGTFLFIVSVGLVRRGLVVGEEMTVVNADLQSDAGELVAGAKFVKATATEDRAVDRLSRTVMRLRDLTFSNAFDVQIVRAIFEYASGFVVILLLVAGPTLLAVDVGTVVVIVAMFIRLFPKVTGLRQCQQSISLVLPAFDAVTLMATEAEGRAERSLAAEGAERLGAGPASIALENVHVVIGERTILDGIDLTIKAGEFVVLTGPTGAGKTTLLDCMLGLRRIQSGMVRIDGQNLNTLAVADWRRGVGYLGQDPMLFHASIEDNLRWIRPDTTSEAIEKALRLASADFVYRLPDGLKTIVGDSGSRLSGGERQRIALARALLGEPRLLVLDEATSALDGATEASVVETIAKLKGRMTIVSITHRPALVAVADRMIEVQHGKVATAHATPQDTQVI